MKKHLLFLCWFSALAVMAIAQAPNAIPYQGVARNGAGNILGSQAISLRISIHDATANGTVVYRETHSVTTSSLGLFSINIGQGTPVTGTLAGVNWGSGAKFIRVELDAAGGNTYTDMGTTQLNSVPYALFAGSSANLPNGNANGNTMRWNGTAWVADNIVYNDGSRVGIGTAAPANRLSVAGKANITDSLGIGIATPAARLDVAGNVKIADGTQGAGKVLKSDASGLASWGKLTGADVLSSSAQPDFSCMGVASSISTDFVPGMVKESGDYAYVVNNSGNNLQVFSIINPASLTLVSSIATGGDPRAVAIAGSFAYVVNGIGNTMQVININDPSAPVITGSVATGNRPFSVAVSGNFAFIVNSLSNSMQVIDISNPALPTIVGSLTTGSNPVSIAVSGNFVYVVNRSSNNMQVIDVSNPSAPTLAGSVTTGTGPTSIDVSGNFAYVTNASSNTLQVINISNPAAPVVTASVSTSTNPRSVIISGKYAFLVNFFGSSMQVIDISNPLLPAVAFTFSVSARPSAITVSGNYAYITNDITNTLQAIKLSCATPLAINPLTGEATATSTIPIANGGTGSSTQNFVDLTTTQNIGGAKTWTAANTFSAGLTATTLTSTVATGTAPFTVASTTPVANLNIGGNAATASTAGNVTGVVAIANGGTGSSTQNFVDLSNIQIIGGAKTWSGAGSFNAGITVTGTATATSLRATGLSTAGIVTNTAAGVLGTTTTLPITLGGTGSSTQNFVDLTNTQTIGGAKTWTAANTFNLDAVINGATVGRGGGNISTNIALGTQALNANTTGSGNTSAGFQSLLSNTTGSNNTALGIFSLFSNTSGIQNTAVGLNALFSNTSGRFNTAVGYMALADAGAAVYSNVAVGYQALRFNTAPNTVAVGDSALYINTGSRNTALGSKALFANSSGSNNTANGFNALLSNTGSGNTAIGSNALLANTSGSNNTALGSGADVSTSTLTNATAIGAGAVVNASNKVRIGNSAVTVIEGQVAFTNPSDGRFKTNVTETVQGLSFINKLRPVVYNFQSAKYEAFVNGGVLKASNNNFAAAEKVRQSGFIAQEVEQAAKESGYDFNGIIVPKEEHQTYSLSYSQFVVPLVKAVQELSKSNEIKDQEIAAQQAEIDELKKQVEEIKTLLLKTQK